MEKKIFFITIVLIATGICSPAQQVIIGTPTAVQHARLEIQGSVGSTVAVFGADKTGISIGADAPSIGFNYLNNTGHQTIRTGYAALMSMDPFSGDLAIANFNGSLSVADFGSITDYQVRMLIKQNGNVGIGTTTPGFPLTVRSFSGFGGITQESADGTARVGFKTATNQAIVQTWTNIDLNFTTGNGVSKMMLKTNGNFQINKSLEIRQKLTSTATGPGNILPLAMGKINFDGTVLKATPNIAVTKLGIGKYQVTIIGETNLYANRSDYMVQVSAEANAFAYMVNYDIQTNNTLVIELHRPRVSYTDDACSCQTFSYITNLYAQENGDGNFSFIVTKF
jgi:hypothetical protein